MAKTQAPYDDGDGASGVVAYTDADGGTVPVGVAAYVEGGVAVPVDAAHPLPVTLPTGAASEETTAAIAEGIGAPDDAAAGTDTGTWSLVSLVKRGLQALATLVSRVPALVGGRVPVDGSGVTQPVSGPVTNAELRAAAVPVAATLVGQTGTVAVGDGGGSLTVDGALSVTGDVSVIGPVTDAQLRASPVPTVEYYGASVVVNIPSGSTGTALQANSGSLPVGANAWMVSFHTPTSTSPTIAFGVTFIDPVGNLVTCPVVWGTATRVGVGALVTGQEFHQGVPLTIFRAHSEGMPIRVTLAASPSTLDVVITFAPIFAPAPAASPVRLASGVTNPVQITAGMNGGQTQFKLTSAATTNATVVNGGTRNMYHLWAHNSSASTKYLKVYSKATVPTTSDVPVLTYPLPAGWAGVLFSSPVAHNLIGIGIMITGGAADNDATAVAAGDVFVNMHFSS